MVLTQVRGRYSGARATTACRPSQRPRATIKIPANRSSCWGGINLASHRPSRTPTKLGQIRATEAPMNTTPGLPDWADNNRAASWVLSPYSAKKTLVKVVMKATPQEGADPFSGIGAPFSGWPGWSGWRGSWTWLASGSVLMAAGGSP